MSWKSLRGIVELRWESYCGLPLMTKRDGSVGDHKLMLGVVRIVVEAV